MSSGDSSQIGRRRGPGRFCWSCRRSAERGSGTQGFEIVPDNALDGRVSRLSNAQMSAQAKRDAGDAPGNLMTQECRAVLTCYATGMLTHDVSQALGMSSREVQLHLRMAAKLLGAATKLEAVVKALRLGIIDVPEGCRAFGGAHRSES